MEIKMETNKICIGCWRWKGFGQSCHSFWEGKTECSHFMVNEMSPEEYISEQTLSNFDNHLIKILNEHER